MSTNATGAGDDRPRSPASLLFQTPYGRFFAANLVGNVGFWLQDIAAILLLFQLTGSAVWVAAVAAIGFGASICTAFVGGFFADRFDRRMVIVGAHALVAIASAVVAIVNAASHSVAAVLVLTAVVGAARGVYSPVAQAIVSELVPQVDFAGAAGLTALGFNLARALGPALGAALFIALGAPVIFASTAAFSAIALVLVLTLSVRGVGPGRKERIRPSVRQYLSRRPGLVVLLIVGAMLGMLTDPVNTLGPALGESWSMQASFAGWLVSAFGAGAVLAGPFSALLRRLVGRVALGMLALVIVAIAFAVIAASGSAVVGIIGFGAAGFAYLACSTDVTAAIQERVDDEVRGRVWGFWAIGFLGSRPIAAIVNGVVADTVSPRAALVVMAGVALLAFGMLWWSRRLA